MEKEAVTKQLALLSDLMGTIHNTSKQLLYEFRTQTAGQPLSVINQTYRDNYEQMQMCLENMLKAVSQCKYELQMEQVNS